MSNIWKISRPTLISAARAILLRADDARLVPDLLPWLQSAEEQLKLLTTSYNASGLEAHTLTAQAALTRAAEEDLDRQVSALCHRLRGESNAGDSRAMAAMQLLFPDGSTELTKFGGRNQLTRYNAFAERLNIAALPAQMTGSAVQILTALQTFDAALTAKEQADLRRKTAIQEVKAADHGLRNAMSLLDSIASHHLSPAVMAKWTEPIRTLARRSRAAPSPERAG